MIKNGCKALTKKGLLLAIFLLSLLFLAAIIAVAAWMGLEETKISFHGFIALGLGVFATLGLGAGLMFLVFYSHRKGYDDEADEWRKKDP